MNSLRLPTPMSAMNPPPPPKGPPPPAHQGPRHTHSGMPGPRGPGLGGQGPTHPGFSALRATGMGGQGPRPPGQQHAALSSPGLHVPVPGTFAPLVRSMIMERFRSPGFAAMLAANRMPFPGGMVPGCGGVGGFPQLVDPRGTFPGSLVAPFPAFMFTQEDVDMVLYGYARNRVNEHLPGHALSGLRTSQLTYGMDRILGGCPAPSNKHAMGQIDPNSVELPEGLELFHANFAGSGHYGVFCRKSMIPKGTRFGPFQGKVVNTSEIKSNDDNSYMWEIFKEGKLSHFVDGRGAAGNWMAFVNCSRYAQEQNLLAIQVENQIYYEACKDISQGTELLVWYGECYLQFMGIPVALKEMSDPSVPQEAENSEGYECARCGKVFAYKYYRDKHLKYTRCVDMGDRKFPCHLCSRSFEKRDRLRIHILHVHEKHRPHKCNVCGKCFSQSSSLNKHMRVHSGERPYKCVYCSKAFTASSILRTHIRQHSGEKPFKCKHCGKAFASHAAHDSHVRRTHTKDRPSTCTVCGKSFAQSYELKFHMRTHDNSQHYSDINMNDKLLDEAIDVVGIDQGSLSVGAAL